MKKTIIFILITIIFFLGSIFLINYNKNPQYILESNKSITQLRINDVEIKDEKLIKDIGEIFKEYRYNKKQRRLDLQSGYVSVFEIDFMIGDEIRHIILGDLDVIYESSKIYYNIISGDQLTDEISNLFNYIIDYL